MHFGEEFPFEEVELVANTAPAGRLILRLRLS